MYGVELYAAVRLAVVDEGLSHHDAGRRFGIDRRTVKKMLSYSAPPGYRRTKPVRRPKLDGFTGIVDAILEADTDPDVPRKQRHTAHRIFERLRDEHGFAGGYTMQTVWKLWVAGDSVRLMAMLGSAMRHIPGVDRSQVLLLPEAVDDYVGRDNPVRFIDAFVDGLDLAAAGFERAAAKAIGRPGYDPADLLKLYIYGYLNRVRSSRRLEAESKRNLEVIWLLRRLSPDFKTIADFRRINRAAFRQVFREFVRLCRELELFGRELVAVDGTRIKAVNSRKRNFTKAKLAKALAESDERLSRYLDRLDEADEQDEVGLPSQHHGSTLKTYVLLRYAQRPEEEVLCDVFAAECLLPYHPFANQVAGTDISLDAVKSFAQEYKASLTTTGSRFALNANEPCAFVLIEDGRIRYVSRSKYLNEMKGWINFNVPVPEASVAQRLLLLREWNQCLSLIWFDESLTPVRERWDEDENKEPLLKELDGTLPWPSKSRRR